MFVSLYLCLQGWRQLYYPNWEIFLSSLKPSYPNKDTNRTLLGNPRYQLYYPNWEIILSWLKPYSPDEDTNSPQSGNHWVTQCSPSLKNKGWCWGWGLMRAEAGSGKREAGSGKREAGSGKREARSPYGVGENFDSRCSVVHSAAIPGHLPQDFFWANIFKILRKLPFI